MEKRGRTEGNTGVTGIWESESQAAGHGMSSTSGSRRSRRQKASHSSKAF